MEHTVWQSLKQDLMFQRRLVKMARDDTKLNYYSGWDIDQLLTTNSVSVSTGANAVYAVPSSNPIPVFEVQFKPIGSTFWYRPGTSSTNGTVAGEFTVYTYISALTIFINTTVPGTARYFVWSDKVNY